MIREATVDDVPSLVEMGARFIAETVYRNHVAINPRALANLMLMLIDSSGGAVFVSELDGKPVGMIGAQVYPHPMSMEFIGAELFWWVEPDARGKGSGIKLLKKAEEWADERGAVRMQMIAPNDKVGRVYAALGYTKIEEQYQRDI